MIWLAVFPTLTVVNLALGDWLGMLTPVVRTFVLATIAVPIVIYGLMPHLHRLRAPADMRIIERAVDIQAPPAAVWQFLTDTDRYEDWNPFMPQLSGRFASGERLTLTVRPGTRMMTFRPTVLAVVDATLIRWRGRLGLPGLFDGEHELRLESLADGGTRFVQREAFTGLLVPMMPRVLDDTAAGFAAMNAALRDRAGSRAGDEEQLQP
jgi:hypothetical protein